MITDTSLKAVVQTLAADSFQGRLSGSLQAKQAAEFISEAFKNCGAIPIADSKDYLIPFQLQTEYQLGSPFNFEVSSGELTSNNVVAILPGRSKNKEIIIFSAHYDHLGTKKHSLNYEIHERGKPEAGDEIYNGANDNASGISGLIHLARYFSQQPNRERTIAFIAFSGEEEGLLGSKALVERLDKKTIKAVINMDMIGRPLAEDEKFPYITGDKHSNLRSLLNKKLAEKAPGYGNDYFKGDQFPIENLYKRSDNYPFVKAGVPAHTIMATSPIDIYYHSLNDEWETLDYPFMAEVVKAIALATTGLVDGSDTPRK